MQVTIEKLVYGGAGLARTSEGVVFVPKTAEGDVAEVEITEKKKDYARASLRRIIVASADRKDPACPNYKTVGCCHWDHIRYHRQLDYKEAILRESLKRLAKIDFEGEISRITGPEYAYRLRATFHLRNGSLGFVRENSDIVVPIAECAALTPELNEFIRQAGACRIPAVSADVVASADAIAATFHFPDVHPQQPWQEWRNALFEIPNLSSLTFTSGSNRVHYERRRPAVEVHGIRYELTSDAFFQANRFLLTRFVEEAVEQAGTGLSNVLDLFCGSGFFSLPLARRCSQLIGVEANRIGVKQAQANAKLNQISNCEFVAAEVEAALANADVRPDAVVLNPPRTGAGPNVSAQIAALKAPRIIYVSCNPTTFAREAGVFIRNGYRLKRLTMIDQFPNTYHIEFIAQFDSGLS